jgi:hypothetical protein
LTKISAFSTVIPRTLPHGSLLPLGISGFKKLIHGLPPPLLLSNIMSKVKFISIRARVYKRIRSLLRLLVKKGIKLRETKYKILFGVSSFSFFREEFEQS